METSRKRKRISVTISDKTYNKLRKVLNDEEKTSRRINNYLESFIWLVEGGLDCIKIELSKKEIELLYDIINDIVEFDETEFNDLASMNSYRLSCILEIWDCDKSIVDKVKGFDMWECVAIVLFCRIKDKDRLDREYLTFHGV